MVVRKDKRDKYNKYFLSKLKDEFATRLLMNESPLTREREIVHLGIRITENLSWDEHVAQICRKAYARVKMLAKLKYFGVQTKDLIELYAIHIRSVT